LGSLEMKIKVSLNTEKTSWVISSVYVWSILKMENQGELNMQKTSWVILASAFGRPIWKWKIIEFEYRNTHHL
jgi:hypothetical protein